MSTIKKKQNKIFLTKGNKYMSLFNDELIEKIIQMTWRNPAFMALAIAMVWLIPQLLIRRIMAQNYEKSKLTKQKQKIDKLYPSSFK